MTNNREINFTGINECCRERINNPTDDTFGHLDSMGRCPICFEYNEILPDYYCPQCETWFAEPDVKTWKEWRPFGDSGCHEEMNKAVCPNCGNEYFEKKEVDKR